MTVNRFAMPFFIIGLSIIIFLAAVMVTLKLAGDVVHSIGRKLGLVHRDQEPIPFIDVYPTGDIPQPETANIANKLSVHQ